MMLVSKGTRQIVAVSATVHLQRSQGVVGPGGGAAWFICKSVVLCGKHDHRVVVDDISN